MGSHHLICLGKFRLIMILHKNWFLFNLFLFNLFLFSIYICIFYRCFCHASWGHWFCHTFFSTSLNSWNPAYKHFLYLDKLRLHHSQSIILLMQIIHHKLVVASPIAYESIEITSTHLGINTIPRSIQTITIHFTHKKYVNIRPSNRSQQQFGVLNQQNNTDGKMPRLREQQINLLRALIQIQIIEHDNHFLALLQTLPLIFLLLIIHKSRYHRIDFICCVYVFRGDKLKRSIHLDRCRARKQHDIIVHIQIRQVFQHIHRQYWFACSTHARHNYRRVRFEFNVFNRSHCIIFIGQILQHLAIRQFPVRRFPIHN